MRAAGYIRVSKLRKKDDKVSPETQKQAIVKLAIEDGYAENDIDWYIDLDYSGKDTDRKDFPKMILRVKSGAYKDIYVYDLTRFSRNVLDFHVNAKILDEMGCRLKAAVQNMETETIEGEFARNIIVDAGDYQRKKIAQDVKKNMHIHAENGNWNGGSVPYGFTLLNKKLATDESTIANVGHIIAYMANGSGANAIIGFFYRRNTKSPTGKAKWSKNTILGIVRNPLYVGKYWWGGKLHNAENVFADYKFKEYIHAENWIKANRNLDCRGKIAPRSRGSQHLLSSMIRCPKCGRRLNIRYNGKRHVRRYMCPGRNDYVGERCDCPIIDADTLETSVVASILDIVSCPEAVNDTINAYRSYLRASEPDTQAKKREVLKRLKRVKGDMEKMFGLYRDEVITKEQLREQNKLLLDEENILKADLATLEQQSKDYAARNENMETFKKCLLELEKTWNIATPQEKREYLSAIVKEVEIIDNGVMLACEYGEIPIQCKLKTNTTMIF